jgi:hypothetical protein
MTGTKAHEYDNLERESSSQLMEHDSRQVLGRYEEAAYAALQAGRGRARMGQLCFEAEEYVEATEDWLSAAACLLLATETKHAARVLDLLHRLDVDGKIPAERPDLHATLRERDQELTDLKERMQQFLRNLGLQGHQVDVADERTLRFLLDHVRDLPGFARLHYLIFRQASDLRQQPLADKHLVWAAAFEPDNPNLVALLGYLHLACGRPDLAVGLGKDFLAAHSSDSGSVRIMLAHALAADSGASLLDLEEAIDVLRHLIEDSEVDLRKRIAALALSATFSYELGREEDFIRNVQELDHLKDTIQAPELRSAIADFLGMMPRSEVNGTGEVQTGPRHLLPEGERKRLFQKVREMTVPQMPLVA